MCKQERQQDKCHWVRSVSYRYGKKLDSRVISEDNGADTAGRHKTPDIEREKREYVEANLLKFAKPRELRSNDYPDSCMTQPEMMRKLIAEKIMPEKGSLYDKFLEKKH